MHESMRFTETNVEAIRSGNNNEAEKWATDNWRSTVGGGGSDDGTGIAVRSSSMRQLANTLILQVSIKVLINDYNHSF